MNREINLQKEYRLGNPWGHYTNLSIPDDDDTTASNIVPYTNWGIELCLKTYLQNSYYTRAKICIVTEESYM